MHVAAVSTPDHPEWRWRIATYAGEVVAQSPGGFESMAAALAEGRRRLSKMNVIDRSEAARVHWASRRPR